MVIMLSLVWHVYTRLILLNVKVITVHIIAAARLHFRCDPAIERGMRDIGFHVYLRYLHPAPMHVDCLVLRCGGVWHVCIQ